MFAQMVPCPSDYTYRGTRRKLGAVAQGGVGEAPGCNGLVAGHAYNIRQAGWFRVAGKRRKLLQLYNPWAGKGARGVGEWTGAFSEDSKEFREFEQLCDFSQATAKVESMKGLGAKRGVAKNVRPPIFDVGGRRVLHKSDTVDVECHIAADGLFWIEWHDLVNAALDRIAKVTYDLTDLRNEFFLKAVEDM